MRIALICDEYPPKPHGGIGSFVSTFAKGLKDAGHEAAVLETGPSTGCRKESGINLLSVREPRIRHLHASFARFRMRRLVSDLLQDFRPDVIEVPDFGGWLPFPPRRVPSVVRLHTSTGLLSRGAGCRIRRSIDFFERQTLRNSPFWLGPSKFILDETEQFYGIRPRSRMVVHNPVTLPREDASVPVELARGGRLVLYAGYVSEMKGALDLAYAAKVVLPRFPDAFVAFVGRELSIGGVTASELIRQIVGPALSSRVVFTGRLTHAEVFACMRKAAVFVLPSHLESFGLVYVEAMAAGAPVVATSRAAGPEVVADGVSGLTADPADHLKLADQISRVLSDNALADQLARNAKRLVQGVFSLDRCVRESVGFYSSVIDRFNSASCVE